MSFDPRRFHLTSWREVQDHLGDADRWSRYRRLMLDFGIDPDIVSQGERQAPRFLYAEHPGNWAYPADVIRIRLAAALAQRFGGAAEILQFDNDVFRMNGIKRFFTQWCLHPQLPWVSLVRAKDARAGQLWHRRVYGSIRLAGTSRQSLIDKFTVALELLRCVADGKPPLELLNGSWSPSAREVLGGPWSRGTARQLAESMAMSRLDAAQLPLTTGLDLLRDQPTWSTLWQRINSTFLGQPVGRIDPIFETFLLAIRDPEKMARKLASMDGVDRVPVAAMVEHGEFRLVIYDCGRRRFLALRSTGDTDGKVVVWDDVRRQALEGRGGTPSATVEYLMMAAQGFMVVCDPYDGQTPFEQRVAQLHQQAVGRRFPWVSLKHRFIDSHCGSYLDCYHVGLDQFAQKKIDDEFFTESPT